MKEIIEDNHVLHIDPRIGSLVKNKGAPSIASISWNKISTFNGFCQKHDNELFEPIDNNRLIPTEKQVMLYAYRSICREYYVKENKYETAKEYTANPSINLPVLERYCRGMKFGFENLKYHKNRFDESLSNQIYNDIVYVTFMSTDTWNTQFSGVLYPDFDFLGNQLQNLQCTEKRLDLITLFTAPTNNGWAFVFAWHKSSDTICSKLLLSLIKALNRGEKIEDCIFRISISCCENHAFRPSWWKGLSDEDKNKILTAARVIADINIPTPNTYIAEGLDGIVSWSFLNVISTM